MRGSPLTYAVATTFTPFRSAVLPPFAFFPPAGDTQFYIIIRTELMSDIKICARQA